MAVKMYRTALGSWVEYKDGDKKHDPTHVLLSDDEYDELTREIRRLNSLLSRKEQEKKDEVKRIKNEAAEYKRQADAEAQEVKRKAEAAKAVAEAERDRQTNLNENLLRITKERANAKRGLRPKKRHHGYRFSGKIMQTKTISGHNKKTGAIYTDVWTTILETPYDGTIPIDQIQDRIFSDLMGSNGILWRLSVRYWPVKGNHKMIWKGTYMDVAEDADDHNCLFDYKFMVNPKSGLWEVQIMTTKPIRVVPEMMGERVAQTDSQKKTAEEDAIYADDSGLDETSNPKYEEDDEDEDDEWW